MRYLTNAAAALFVVTTSAYAVSPSSVYFSPDEVMQKGKTLGRIERNLKRDGFIAQDCQIHSIYYIMEPDQQQYLSNTADCRWYKPHDGIGFETDYAFIKQEIMYDKVLNAYYEGQVDVTYTTVY
ncbi:hypothetical protein [Aliikangiella sp. G2MR2-5]|uniref:hypothetical protein n=1 Tax=Aliikangiella sp. G2MR2-5 TaxID=2788943 RepID=UPI0018AC8900|nr:hypothetical protein [Aliikangiella sp. G2MR2-5]